MHFLLSTNSIKTCDIAHHAQRLPFEATNQTITSIDRLNVHQVIHISNTYSLATLGDFFLSLEWRKFQINQISAIVN